MRTLPAILAVLVAAGCGSSTTPSSQPTSGAAAPGGGTRITVTETDFKISLPSTTLTPGTYTFAVDNSGAASHDLFIKGPGVDSAKTTQLKRGEKGEVTVTLQAGKYDLWCSVGNHKARGMETTVTVS